MLKRLKQLRKLLGLTQQEFASAIGLKQGSYSMIENGATPLNAIHIKVICTTFNVNEEWLREGLEPVFIGSKDEKCIVEIFNGLSKSSQEYLLDVARGLLKLQKEWEEEDAGKAKGSKKGARTESD